jgi:hypothetical protein
MRFLKGHKKTAEEDFDESQDEFNAEESGLLMTESAVDDGQEAELTAAAQGEDPPTDAVVEDGDLSVTSEEEGEAAESDVAPPPEAGDATLQVVDESSSPDKEESAVGERDSSDSSLDLFKSAASSRDSVNPLLKDELGSVSAADLLTEARAVCSMLLRAKTSAGTDSENERAA